MIASYGLNLHHWNYFLSLEEDLKSLTRYIEFTEENLNTYSIELAHILLSASAEIDVVLKSLTNLISDDPAESIGKYKKIIKEQLPGIIDEPIFIERYGLEFHPWENWKKEEEHLHPLWWNAYNKVKHHRDIHFKEANLKNVINAVGGLFIMNLYYYRELYKNKDGVYLKFSDIINKNGGTLLINGDPEYRVTLLRVS